MTPEERAVELGVMICLKPGMRLTDEEVDAVEEFVEFLRNRKEK